MADSSSGDPGGDDRPVTVTDTADSLRERAGENRVKLWLFFEADRRLVATASAVFVFAVVVLAGVLTPEVTAVLRSGDPIETMFQAFIGSIITGVTLVVTLNQLVLSQEFGTLDEQRERFEGAAAVRETVAEHVDREVAPADLSAFVRVIVEAAADDAAALRDTLDDAPEDLAAEVDTLADDIQSNADAVTDQLEGASFGTFEVLSAALDFNYSLKIHDARRLRVHYEDDLSDASLERFDELITTLELFPPAREHVKTLLVQWELIDLSRYVLATSIPGLLVAVCMLLFYSPGTPGGAVLGVPMAVVVVSAAVTVSALPFLVLLSYVLRIASVTKRTLAIGTFTTRDTDEQNE